MDDQFEAHLRQLLTTRAVSIPPDVLARVRQREYQPQVRRTRRRAAIGLSGASAVGAAAAAAVLLGGATPAFAGWTATPASSGTKQASTATSNCVARLSALPTAPGGTWNALATDVRGPYTLAVYENSGIDGTCLTGPSITAISVQGSGAASQSVSSGGGSHGAVSSSSSMIGPIGSGIQKVSQDHLTSSEGPYTVIEGAISPDVSGITFELADGTSVQATLGGGWYLAWWPSSAAATAAEVTTQSGTVSQPLG